MLFVVKKNQIVENGGGCDTCCVVCQLYACFFFQIFFECQLKTNVSAILLQQFILLLAVIISSVSMNMFLQLGFNIDFHFPKFSQALSLSECQSSSWNILQWEERSHKVKVSHLIYSE